MKLKLQEDACEKERQPSELFFSSNEDETLSEIEVSKLKVLEQIHKLKSNKSPWPDGIHLRALKELKN